MPRAKRAFGSPFALAVLLAAAGPALAQVVGVAMSVRQGAVVDSGGSTVRLVPRAEISNGDVIRTDASGLVQITFRDRSRVVVGPDTEFRIDDVSLSGAGRAERFLVTALGGVFRFLSGDSPRESYELRTPTATMGIRGTVFDVAIDPAQTTWLVTFEGAVRTCGRDGRCAVASGGCAMVLTDRSGRVRPPEDRRVRDAALNTHFPLITDARALGLRGDFGAPTESCGEIDALLILAPPRQSQPAQGIDDLRNGDRGQIGVPSPPDPDPDRPRGKDDP